VREEASAPVVAQVADVDAIHAQAVRRGLELVYPLTDEPRGVRRFLVKDPNGLVLTWPVSVEALRLPDGEGTVLPARRINAKRGPSLPVGPGDDQLASASRPWAQRAPGPWVRP
jgi:hypothetical protein